MKLTKNLLEEAIKKDILSANQAQQLTDLLNQQNAQQPPFTLSTILYYLGGMIAISAMTFFMNLGFEKFGGLGIFFTALIYAFIGLGLASHFKRKSYAIAAGICATFVIALTPLAIYGLQKALGLWPDVSNYRQYHQFIKWHWLYMELGTLIVGVVLLKLYKYPFLVMPIAVTLWYLSMDLAIFITGEYANFDFRALFSLWFGLGMLVIALFIDFRTQHSQDYAFWLYLLGMLAFWVGLTSQLTSSETAYFFYFCINFLLIVTGVILIRRVFVLFGGLGIANYLGHLAYSVFQDDWLFPIALTAIGLIIVYLGTLWQKNEVVIREKLLELLPKSLRGMIDNHLPSP